MLNLDPRLHPGRHSRLRRASRQHLHGSRGRRIHPFRHRLHVREHREVGCVGVRDYDPGLSFAAADHDRTRRVATHFHSDVRRAAVRYRRRHQRRLRLCNHGPNGRWRDRHGADGGRLRRGRSDLCSADRQRHADPPGTGAEPDPRFDVRRAVCRRRIADARGLRVRPDLAQPRARRDAAHRWSARRPIGCRPQPC